MSTGKIRKSLQTALLHGDYEPPPGFKSLSTPVHHVSTVVFEDVASMRARRWEDHHTYTYGLHGTPTTFTLEAKLAELEGGQYAILAPSGLSAITIANFAFLQSGDDVLIPENIYNPNRELGYWLKENFNISARYYNPMMGAAIGELMQANTRLVWVETPGSVTMEVPDVPAICQAVHDKGGLVIVDNTWSAGLGFNAFEHGADMVLHALTKYQSGAGDLLMGVLITRDEYLYERLCYTHMRLGIGVGADDVYLILRNLPSMKLRFEKHGESALEVARWLKTRPEIARVLHPALEDCPGHAFFERDFTGAGGLFSILFDERYTEAQTDRFVEALNLFQIGFSWGGMHSLSVPFRVVQERKDWQWRNNQLVRLYIGLEDTADLIADLSQALDVLKA